MHMVTFDKHMLFSNLQVTMGWLVSCHFVIEQRRTHGGYRPPSGNPGGTTVNAQAYRSCKVLIGLMVCGRCAKRKHETFRGPTAGELGLWGYSLQYKEKWTHKWSSIHYTGTQKRRGTWLWDIDSCRVEAPLVSADIGQQETGRWVRGAGALLVCRNT